MKLATRLVLLLATSACAAALVGCGRHSSAEHFYLVATNTKLTYWQSASAGLDKIAKEWDVHADMRGPRDFDPQGEVDEFRSVVALKPAGILVSVVDSKLMQPEIDAAIAAVERWWRDERKAFQIASALGYGNRLSLEVLSELRLMLRLMRYKNMRAAFGAIVAALGDETTAEAAE